MVLEGKARIIQSEASRTVIRLSQGIVKDSQFPFRSGENLTVRIDVENQRLIIGRADPAGGPKKKAR